jgi:hypothetical protein
VQEHGVCEEAILSELPNAQADKSLSIEGLTMLEEKKGDNPVLLCQDCSTPLFRWFLSRVDWVRVLKQMKGN